MSKLLESDLSYKIRGCFYSVFNKYGPGLKEIIYQKALEEEFNKQKVKFYSQKRINIYSLDSGKLLGTYIPDFIVEEKIIVELKANSYLTQIDINQQRSYLRANMYEIAYLVNFGINKLEIKRSIYTNDRKPFYIRVNPSSLIRGNLCSFTLMELLIIIGLIAILAVASIVLFNPMKQIGKANDTKRKKDFDLLQKTFEDFYNDKSCYPKPEEICYDYDKLINICPKNGSWINKNVTSQVCHICGSEPNPPSFSSFSPYLSSLPCDPEHPGKKYLYEVSAKPNIKCVNSPDDAKSDCPSWFALYTDFSVNDDSNSVDLNCDQGACGIYKDDNDVLVRPSGILDPFPLGYDYGVTSPNKKVGTTDRYGCVDQYISCNYCGETYDICKNPENYGLPENECVIIYPSKANCCDAYPTKYPGGCS